MQSFIFGGDNMPKTPQELARLRAVAEAMTPRRTPQNVGEGIDSIGKAILYRSMMGKADKAENAGISSANDAFSSLFSSPDVASVDTAAVPPIDTSAIDPTAPVTPVDGTMQNARMVDRNSVPDYAPQPQDLGFAKVLGAGKGWTEVAGPDGKSVRREGARNWRNNNPGNIEYGDFAKRLGAIGTDGRFAVFPSYEAGRKAKASLLFENPNYKDKTLSAAISRYAPSFENDTGGYISAVAKATGVSPDTVLSNLTPDQREAMMDAMQKVEGFRPGKEMPLDASALQSADMPKEDPFASQPGLTMPQDQVPVVPVPNGFQQSDPLAMQQQQPVEVADNSNYFPPAPRKKVAQALSRLDPQKAFEVLNNPYLPEGRKETIRALLRQQFETDKLEREQELKLADPKYQLDLKKGQIELKNLETPPKARNLTDDEEKAMGLDPSGVYQAMPDNTIKTVREAEKATADWAKLDDNRLFNQKTGIIKDASSDKVVGFRFPGSSVEASALNGLIDNGTITEKQAMDIAAGKQLTGPNGEIMFATPQALIGAQPQQQTQDGGIDIFAGDKPVDAAPVANQPKDGMVPLTQPKVTIDERKAATFADRVTASGAIIDEMGMKGTNATDKALNDWMPFGTGDYLTSNDFKKVDQAKRDFINSVLRRESGAVISDSEFDNANRQYFPHPDDPPELVKQKAANRKLIIDGLKRDAGPTYKGVVKEKVPGVPEGVDPGLWEHMTPEERKLWQN